MLLKCLPLLEKRMFLEALLKLSIRCKSALSLSAEGGLEVTEKPRFKKRGPRLAQMALVTMSESLKQDSPKPASGEL